MKKLREVSFAYRVHDDERVRVWRNDWEGDCFEIMGLNEFQQFRIFCDKFGFVLEFKDQEED